MKPGDYLGSYEILAPLGAGGMGEVYRARDTKLDRDVAIKILPDALANNPERLARFEREAKVLASLNHPNIAQIYGVEDRALVMELVEGATLAGPLPIETALDYARQIAEALEAAHDKGITHRDLKPANVKVTPQGLVKVLDFGLAAVAQAPDVGPDSRANSPTLTLGVTEAGMIMGTAGYMSPEQAAGKPVDRRADIWSFGVLLWELLAGDRLFDGETVSHTLADVLRAPIDLDKLPRETPTKIRELLRRCLDRNVKKRLRDIGEARIALEDPGGTEAPLQPEARAARLPWAVAAALGLALLALGVWFWRATRPAERPLVRLDVDLGSAVVLSPLNRGSNNVILSPDGSRLVYVAGAPARLYTRRLDQSKANELPGTEEAIRPFFSPDGQWVGFFTDRNGNKLFKMSVEGGGVVPVADLLLSGTIGGSWDADDNIIVGGMNRGLLRVPASGGAPTTVLERASGAGEYVFPQILPGGKAVLFSDRTRDANTNSIEVFSFADRRNKTLVRGGYSGRYLPSGHLVYANKGTLFAIPFDVDKLETRGTAVPVLDDVAYNPGTGGVDVDFAGTSTLVYRRGTPAAGATGLSIQWLDGTGKKEALRAKPAAYRGLRLSPDGQRLALLTSEGGGDVWVYDPQRDAMTRLTFGGGLYSFPVWSPDGRYVFFAAPGKGIYWTRADGAGQPQLLTQGNPQGPSSFTLDGKRLAYFEALEHPQIWTLPLEEQGGRWKAGKPAQFLQSHFVNVNPAFSPDGHWLAYMSNESGNGEVYVRAFPPPASGQGGQWQISNSGGTGPRWSRNGRELIYQAGDQLMKVSYSVKGDSFLAEKPRVWIQKLGGAGLQTGWDLAPDGKRVVVLTPAGTPEGPKAEHEVTFLLNFFDELRRRAPAGK